eukprot:jgi/Chrzof1/14690/Cz09g12060.t1
MASDVDILKSLSRDIRELDVGHDVEHLPAAPSTCHFLANYVASNKPCVIQGAIDHWPALQCWNDRYFIQRAGSTPVTVDVTPNGRADAVTQYGV